MTVQVKTTQRPAGPVFRYFTGNVGKSTDLMALVALHLEVVLICPAHEMRQRWPVEKFTKEQMQASIREHLA